jgi:predicted ATPase/class 3 adenylate cyclase
VRTDLPRGTVTFLVTDIEGSTRLLQTLGPDGYAALLAKHRRIIRAACRANDGSEVDSQGDAFLVAFTSASGAVRAAAALSDELADGPIRVRVGIHTGEPVLGDEGYVGESLHLAARVAAAAHGGQVVLTGATRDLLDEPLPLTALGEHRLKDIADPVVIFQLGETTFPPLRTIATTNLPRPASSFIGRKPELQETIDLLRGPARVITLTGPGGSGKTRLAIEAARALIPSRTAGVYWVDLAALRDPSDVAETIARTVGARDALVDHIRERDILLVLDNFEQVSTAAPELARLVAACPNLTLLVTSRELLRIRGEVEYSVPPLADDDAVTLFCARSGLEPSKAIADLCARLDDLPLAVELAAARTTVLRPAQILERLGRSLDFLRGGRDHDPRQETIRATISWSYDLLTAEERALFARLSVFVGGCRLEEAEDVAAADLDVLQSLVEKSLVRFSGERYLMLETIREFAADQLAASGELDDVRKRHARWFVALVERAEPELEGANQDVWLDRLAEEHDNVRAALEYAEGDLRLRLSGSMATFWWVHGHWTEGRRLIDRALADPRVGDPRVRAKALEGAAHLASRQLENERATALATESLAIWRGLGDRSGIARSLRVLGLVASGEGDADTFRRRTEESAIHARASGDAWALSMALNNRGYMALEANELESAGRWFGEAIALARDRGDQRSEAFFRENMALTALEGGEPARAHDDFAASLRLSRRLGFVEVAATDLIGLAAVAASHGDAVRAARFLGGAERLLEQTGGRWDPVEARVRARTIEAIEHAIGRRLLDEGVEDGRQRDPEDVLNEALEELLD